MLLGGGSFPVGAQAPGATYRLPTFPEDAPHVSPSTTPAIWSRSSASDDLFDTAAASPAAAAAATAMAHQQLQRGFKVSMRSHSSDSDVYETTDSSVGAAVARDAAMQPTGAVSASPPNAGFRSALHPQVTGPARRSGGMFGAAKSGGTYPPEPTAVLLLANPPPSATLPTVAEQPSAAAAHPESGRD